MPKDTRTDLLDAAELAARSCGFDGFSYADLAEAVGIRKASIHYHFPTKAGLTEALIDRYKDTIAAACEEIVETNEKASHRLLSLIGLYRAALGGGKMVCLCISLTTSHQSLSNEVIEKISEFRDMMLNWIENLFVLAVEDKTIANTTNPRLEAHATLSLLEGAHLAARAAENVKVFDAAVALLKSRC